MLTQENSTITVRLREEEALFCKRELKVFKLVSRTFEQKPRLQLIKISKHVDEGSY